ncbi:MAG: hypothetical protein OXQ29_01710 [Rhodospirillaceae bacterium]|nr:hypothetical protein [Rhodospirillaceae bacterium]
MRALALFACLSLGFLYPIVVVAQYPSALLTPGEQASILAETSNPAVWSRLKSRVAESTAATAPSYQRNHRTRYLAAGLGDRVAIAQTIGEEGVEQYASTRRMKQLLGPHGRSVPIGPDSVYWNRSSGRVRVLEAKGGTSPPNWTYGSLQGTNANTVRSAGGLLESRRAGAAEKLQAARVIKAAQSGQLETAVIRTPHVLGTPLAPRRVGEVHTGNVANEARLLQHELVKRNPELGPIFRRAGAEHRASRLAYRVTPFPSQAGFQNLPGVASISGLTAAGGRGLLMAWQIGNRWIVPVGIGAAGVTVAIQGYHLAVHNIDYTEYVDAIASPAVLLTFTGVGFGIGGMPGAAVGMVLALPVQVYLGLSNDQQLSEAQQQAIEMALRAQYLDARSSPRG